MLFTLISNHVYFYSRFYFILICLYTSLEIGDDVPSYWIHNDIRGAQCSIYKHSTKDKRKKGKTKKMLHMSLLPFIFKGLHKWIRLYIASVEVESGNKKFTEQTFQELLKKVQTITCNDFGYIY